ncbi:SCO family protein [Fulvivirgaceae bacterium BMA10]|uniref:SCO family protein n=1 Tax=Splendidivirga corallicola TaxID=3051826 RepID=A0ABT8KGB0_9BACT|nr:SCO family protein [Fulvivirgaceae bacterium BMA10]
MKVYKLLILLCVLMACSSKSSETENASSNSVREVLPDMSIYHLPAKWHTQNNEQIELKDLQGDVLVMVMIYTSCQAACPRLVADMRNIESQIGGQLKDEVKLILVSIDPETDTPERLKAFAKENQMDNDQWLFLQGTEASVREFANVLAVKYKQISPMDFSHSNIISVFDQKGVLQHQQEGLGVDNKETIAKINELAGNG